MSVQALRSSSETKEKPSTYSLQCVFPYQPREMDDIDACELNALCRTPGPFTPHEEEFLLYTKGRERYAWNINRTAAHKGRDESPLACAVAMHNVHKCRFLIGALGANTQERLNGMSLQEICIASSKTQEVYLDETERIMMYLHSPEKALRDYLQTEELSKMYVGGALAFDKSSLVANALWWTDEENFLKIALGTRYHLVDRAECDPGNAAMNDFVDEVTMASKKIIEVYRNLSKLLGHFLQVPSKLCTAVGEIRGVMTLVDRLDAERVAAECNNRLLSEKIGGILDVAMAAAQHIKLNILVYWATKRVGLGAQSLLGRSLQTISFVQQEQEIEQSGGPSIQILPRAGSGLAEYATVLLQRQLQAMKRSPLDGASVGLDDDDNIFHWKLILIGPPDSVYQDGSFKASLDFPSNFPDSPPDITFESEMFHPNVDPNGKVSVACLIPRVGSYFGNQNVTSFLPVDAIIAALISMLSEPHDEAPLNLEAARLWQHDREGFNRRCRRIVRQAENSLS